MRILEDAAPEEHILAMANVRRDRETAMRRALLVSRIKEAETRAKSPPSSEPVRIRVLHCASEPWLVLDRSSPPEAGGETGVALDPGKAEDGKSSGMTEAVGRV